MAKVYGYTIRQTNGEDIDVFMSEDEASRLAHEIKEDVDPYGNWTYESSY